MDLRLLRLEELLGALAGIHDRHRTEQSERGFRTLIEEPALYNKWLYTTAREGASGHTLLGVSRCFCPITNRPYLDVRTYSPLPKGTSSQSDLFVSLERIAVSILSDLQPEPDRVGIVRGSFGVPDHPYGVVIYENTSQSERFAADVHQRSITREELLAARECVRWLDETGPVWTEGTGRIVLASSLDQHLLYQHEVCVDEAISFPMPLERMRRGIQAIVTYNERHGHLTMFDRGAYLIAERGDAAVGSAWCFRSFDPVTCGWIVWVRRPYVREEYRRKAGYDLDVFGLLIRGAVGLFAEAGYPARVHTLCPRKSNAGRALEGAGFSRVADEDEFFFTSD
jgi:hypothetical protein